MSIITDEYINHQAFLHDYTKYLPHSIVRDLIKVWVLAKYGDYNIATYFPDTPYYQKFLSVISFIDLTDKLPKTGSEFAFDLLMLIHKKVNFRSMEIAKEFDISHFGEEDEDQCNYAFELTRIPASVLEFLNIDAEVLTENYVLSKEVEDILRFYSGMSSLPGIDDKISKIHRKNMTDYNQILKINKWRFLSKHFMYDLVKKNLRVKIPKVEYKAKSDVIIMIDRSFSTNNNSSYISLYKAVLLYYYSKFDPSKTTINIYLFGRSIYSKVLIESREALLDFINTPISSMLDLSGWKYTFHEIDRLIKNTDIVLITDGTETDFDVPRNGSNHWHILSLNENSKLNTLSNSSGGKFIVV
jgi:hypothetical protein